jgi:hypothetical protein
MNTNLPIEPDPNPPVVLPNDPRAVVGVFESRSQAELAVDALRQAGFTGDHIGFAIRGDDAVHGGMLTDASGAKDAKGAAAGMIAGGIIGGILAAGIAALPGFGPVLAGGILASFFGGAIAGTAVGGILGAMTGLGVSEEEARFYQSHFNEGKAIIAVRAENRTAQAADILRRFGGEHIHGEATSPVETGGLFNTP